VTPGTQPDSTLARVEAALAGLSIETVDARDRMTTLVIAREEARGALRALRDRAAFEALTLVTAVDHLPREPRFEVVYQLLSLTHADRVRLKVRLDEDDARVDSIVELFPGASFMEREVYDMFGIDFADHPDLRRLLMPEGYGHHPLRKEFPHQGIEPDRLYREWDAARRVDWDPEQA